MSDLVNGRVKAAVREKRISELDTLFDITTCRHKSTLCGTEASGCSGCAARVHVNCDCPLPQKIPKLELEWLHYQRIKTSEVSGCEGNNETGEGC